MALSPMREKATNWSTSSWLLIIMRRDTFCWFDTRRTWWESYVLEVILFDIIPKSPRILFLFSSDTWQTIRYYWPEYNAHEKQRGPGHLPSCWWVYSPDLIPGFALRRTNSLREFETSLNVLGNSHQDLSLPGNASCPESITSVII